MPEAILSDYFYGDEAGQFQYFRIPRQLITNPKFKHLSTDAKLLYGMLLDRMSLSEKNEWYDDNGRVYIYYTVDEICGDMNCGRDKAMKLLAELDTGKGIGLIERIKQGQGKPTKLYVKRFTTRTIPPKPAPPAPDPFLPFSEVDFSDVQKSEFPTSRSRETRRAEVGKSDPNYIKLNQTDFSYTDPSISPISPRKAADMEMDRYEKREEIKTNIDYPYLQRQCPYDDVESLLELIVDVICSTASTIRIGGEVLPTETVKRRFMQLDSSHIEYVIDSMKNTTTKINNIRAYGQVSEAGQGIRRSVLSGAEERKRKRIYQHRFQSELRAPAQRRYGGHELSHPSKGAGGRSAKKSESPRSTREILARAREWLEALPDDNRGY